MSSHQVHFIQLADGSYGSDNYHLRIQRGTIEGKVRAKRLIVEEDKETDKSFLLHVPPLKNKKFNLSLSTCKSKTLYAIQLVKEIPGAAGNPAFGSILRSARLHYYIGCIAGTSKTTSVQVSGKACLSIKSDGDKSAASSCTHN